jgi:hypothetical protein
MKIRYEKYLSVILIILIVYLLYRTRNVSYREGFTSFIKTGEGFTANSNVISLQFKSNGNSLQLVTPGSNAAAAPAAGKAAAPAAGKAAAPAAGKADTFYRPELSIYKNKTFKAGEQLIILPGESFTLVVTLDPSRKTATTVVTNPSYKDFFDKDLPIGVTSGNLVRSVNNNKITYKCDIKTTTSAKLQPLSFRVKDNVFIDKTVIQAKEKSLKSLVATAIIGFVPVIYIEQNKKEIKPSGTTYTIKKSDGDAKLKVSLPNNVKDNFSLYGVDSTKNNNAVKTTYDAIVTRGPTEADTVNFNSITYILKLLETGVYKYSLIDGVLEPIGRTTSSNTTSSLAKEITLKIV